MESQGSTRLSGVAGSDTGVVVRVKSSRRLKIENVEFKFKEGNAGMDWETVIPIKYDVTLVDSTKTAKVKAGKGGNKSAKGKPFVYQIRLYYNSVLKDDKWGHFYLKTNLKEKKEIQVSGMLEGKKG